MDAMLLNFGKKLLDDEKKQIVEAMEGYKDQQGEEISFSQEDFIELAEYPERSSRLRDTYRQVVDHVVLVMTSTSHPNDAISVKCELLLDGYRLEPLFEAHAEDGRDVEIARLLPI